MNFTGSHLLSSKFSSLLGSDQLLDTVGESVCGIKLKPCWRSTNCLTLVEQNIHVGVDSVMSQAGCRDYLCTPQPL